MGRFFRAVGRRLARFIKRVFMVFSFLTLSLRDAFAEDVEEIVRNTRLMLGTILVLLGTLSFSSDRYCDGNASSYYACTRPATYYYYPWWAILLVCLGSMLIVLWFLRRKQHV